MTITVGSILKMKVRNVKRDPNDLSLAIPSAILPGLNADLTSVKVWLNSLNCGKRSTSFIPNLEIVATGNSVGMVTSK